MKSLCYGYKNKKSAEMALFFFSTLSSNDQQSTLSAIKGEKEILDV
jgi:hypothetical protein